MGTLPVVYWRGAKTRVQTISPTPRPQSSAGSKKASWGTSTRPTRFILFFPSFCLSSSLRLRVMSPP